MSNSGFFRIWSHILRLYYEDLECGLKLVNKLTSEHVNDTSNSVIKVKLATQLLSETIDNVLKSFVSKMLFKCKEYTKKYSICDARFE